MSELKEKLNEKVFEILGEDHEISQQIKIGYKGLYIETVLLAVMTTLAEKIDRLEARIEGRGLH